MPAVGESCGHRSNFFFIAGCGKYTSINEPYTAGPDMDGSHGVPEDRLVLILMQITPEGEEKNGRI